MSLICGTAAYALQSWLFAQLIQVFQFTGQKLKDAANFWALMFFILSLAMLVSYFFVGYVGMSISTVSSINPSTFTSLTAYST